MGGGALFRAVSLCGTLRWPICLPRDDFDASFNGGERLRQAGVLSTAILGLPGSHNEVEAQYRSVPLTKAPRQAAMRSTASGWIRMSEWNQPTVKLSESHFAGIV